MDSPETEEFRRAYRTAAVVTAAMCVSVLIYALAVEIMARKFAPFQGFSAQSNAGVLKLVFLAITGAVLMVVVILRKVVLSPFIPAPLVLKLSQVSVIGSALCATIAVYGFALFLLAGNTRDFYLFAAISLFSLILFFPRYGQWKDLKERHDAKKGRPSTGSDWIQ